MEVLRSIDDYLYFEAVVRHGGFGAASREMNIAKSSLSRRVRILEEHLGVRLIERTTHRFQLTEAGLGVYAHCRSAIAELQTARTNAIALSTEPQGTLRISSPPGPIMELIAGLLPTFQARYPRLRVEMLVGMQAVDVIAERIDVAIRIRARLVTDQELIVKRLGHSHFVLVASPTFLERHDAPQTPEDLTGLPTIGIDGAKESTVWDLESDAGERTSLRIAPVMACNNIQLAVCAAVGGLGIGLVPTMFAASYLRTGQLRTVLTQWHREDGIIHMVFPSRRTMLPAVRAFIDAASEALQRADWTKGR